MEEENNPIKTMGEKRENMQEDKVSNNFENAKSYSNTEYVQDSQKKYNSYALASFICSMVGLIIFGIPCGIAAIVTGILGLVKFDSIKEKGKWMAITGLCVGAVDFILVAFYNVLRVSTML